MPVGVLVRLGPVVFLPYQLIGLTVVRARSLKKSLRETSNDCIRVTKTGSDGTARMFSILEDSPLLTLCSISQLLYRKLSFPNGWPNFFCYARHNFVLHHI
jgi:hypothetical protein